MHFLELSVKLLESKKTGQILISASMMAEMENSWVLFSLALVHNEIGRCRIAYFLDSFGFCMSLRISVYANKTHCGPVLSVRPYFVLPCSLA